MSVAAATPLGTSEDADDGARRSWVPSFASVLVVLGACVPSLVAVVAIAGQRWYASSDQALELLRISDVGGPHTPLLGVYSRWGWAHPGPMLFWVLAPFERAAGTTGVLVGTGVVNLTAAGAAALAGLRVHGLRLGAVVAMVLAALQLGLGLDRLVDPWNPTVAVVPFAAFGVMCWLVALGRPWLLVPAVVLGTFSLQSHVGYLLLVGVPLAVAAVAVVARPVLAATTAGTATDRRRLVRPLSAAAAATGLVLWAPPLWQQLSREPGNLTAIWRYARSPQEPPVGLSEALGSFGAHVRLFGPWVTGNDVDDLGLAMSGSVLPAVAMLIVVTALAVAAWRRRPSAGTLELAVLVGLLVTVATLASARVTGLYAPYVLLFWRGIGALAAMALLWPLASLVVRTRGVWVRPVFAAAGVLAALVLAIVQLPARVPLPEVSAALGELVPEVESWLDREKRYLVRGQDVRSFLAPISGLHVNLERRGWDVYVDPEPLSPLTVGTQRTADEDDVDAILFIVDLTSVHAGFEPPPRSRRIASYDPLTAAERARLLRLEARIRESIGRGPGDEPLFVQNPWLRGVLIDAGASRDDVEALAELHARGDGYIVYLEPLTPAGVGSD